MYFSYFPLLRYTLDDKESYQFVQDIFRRIILTYSTKTKLTHPFYYIVKDGETPEMLADRFYKSTTLHWIILHGNDILDPRFDWPLSTNNLIEFCKEKYGDDNLYAIHHYERIEYEDTDAEMRLISNDVDEDYPITITNWEYEEELNEKKRNIKIILPEIVPLIIAAFEKYIRA